MRAVARGRAHSLRTVRRHENNPTDRRAGNGPLPRRPESRDRRTKAAAVRGRVRHLRPRQRGWPRRGALRRPRCVADLPGAQRTGDGACRDRLRQSVAAQAHDGLHVLDRPRRHQHGHGGGARACQPAAGAPDPRGRLRQSKARSGAAAGRGFRRRYSQRQRLLQARVALFRPHRSARTDRAGAEQGDSGSDGSGRVRAGDARLLPGCADRGLRLSPVLLRGAGASPATHRARPARSRRRRRAFAQREEAPDRLRRRRALFRRRARTDRFLRAARRSGR